MPMHNFEDLTAEHCLCLHVYWTFILRNSLAKPWLSSDDEVVAKGLVQCVSNKGPPSIDWKMYENQCVIYECSLVNFDDSEIDSLQEE